MLLIEGAVQQRDWTSVGVYAAMLVGLIGKTLFELAGGGTLFVESANFTPVPIAHIAGAIVGALIALGRRMKLREFGVRSNGPSSASPSR